MTAQVARASRIWVEGIHDAALVERIWGDDLRIEGVVVEPLDGIDALPPEVREFGPGAGTPARRARRPPGAGLEGEPDRRRRHLAVRAGHRAPVRGRLAGGQAGAVGIRAWPVIPPGRPWKEGVCAALGVAEPADMWRRILSRVHSYKDVETPLINAMERLIDFVTT